MSVHSERPHTCGRLSSLNNIYCMYAIRTNISLYISNVVNWSIDNNVSPCVLHIIAWADDDTREMISSKWA